MNNEVVYHLKALRDLGFAVVAFTPEELRGAEPDHVEDRLIEIGWDVIDALATEHPHESDQMHFDGAHY